MARDLEVLQRTGITAVTQWWSREGLQTGLDAEALRRLHVPIDPQVTGEGKSQGIEASDAPR